MKEKLKEISKEINDENKKSLEDLLQGKIK